MLFSLPFYALFRYRTNAYRRCPRTGPVLLLPNHTSLLDPIWVSHPTLRSANFMAASALFRTPIAPLVRLMGAFPKKKFVKDQDSMATVAQLYEDGEVIVIFVEGTRTWDGRAQPIGDGIGRLVNRLNANVLLTRVLSGHLFHPRWARWPRWVPVVMDYQQPRTFEGWSDTDITAEIRRVLAIDPAADAPRGSFGIWLAEGLPDYLWACPSCLAMASLHVPRRARSEVHCHACEAAWRVDVSSRMTPLAGGDVIRVFEAFDRIEAHYADPESGDPEPGVVLRDRGSLVELVPGGAEKVLGAGPIRLTHDTLEVGQWSRPLAELMALEIGLASAITVRLEGAHLELRPEQLPAHTWHHFLKLVMERS